MATTLLLTLFVVFLQVPPVVNGPPIVPGAQTSGGPTTSVTNNNTFPTPDKATVIATEKEASPVILDSAFRSIDADGGKSLSGIFNLGMSLGKIRKDLILLPAVQELNKGMQRIVTASIALVLVALAFWGILGEAFGSDGREAFEYLARVPLWSILALSSLQWLALVLDFFAALAGMIAASSDAAFGTTLRPDFWSDVGLGLFAIFIGLFYLFNLLLFALQLFANTAFLAFCAVVAPVFVFLKTTPWTSRWGDNWFRMVPGTAGDILAMMTLLVIGGAGLNLITSDSAFQTLALDLGLLMCLPLIRHLFGLEGHSVGSRFINAALLARALKRGAGNTPPATPTRNSTNVSTPTRAPRVANQYGTAATRRPVRYAPGSRPVGA